MIIDKETTAVVVGGGNGIGAMIAQTLGRAGATVLIADRDELAAGMTAASVEALGGKAFAKAFDLSSPEHAIALAEAVERNLGSVDLLINHAGVSVAGLWEAIPNQEWRRILDTNVAGTAEVIARLLPLMRSPGGHIVNTASGLGLFHDLPFAAPYIASKAAIIAMSRALAEYLGGRRIGVSVFCPDLTNTAFVTSGALYGIDPQVAAAGIPWGAMQTAEVAAEALFKGLAAERFLISLVPDTDMRLVLMATRQLAPRSDRLQAGGQAKGVLVVGQLGLPANENRSIAIAALKDFATATREEPGCIEYALSLSLDDPDTLVLREIWESDAALAQHQGAPSTLEFLGRAQSLGFTSFTTEQRPVFATTAGGEK